MINLVYCCYCFEMLKEKSKNENKGKMPLWAYEHICEHFAIYQMPLEICDDLHAYNHGFLEAVAFLEHNRFVYSRETGIDMLKIFPIGLTCEDNEFHFCPTSHLTHA